VASLLRKAKDDNNTGRDIKRRQRKNKDQLGVLDNEFKKNPDWSREYIRRISTRLGLRECQVYKWHWDQRKKEGLEVANYDEYS
jgi:Homeodomain